MHRNLALSLRLVQLFALGGGLIALPTALACRYNVRDLGFIEVDSEDYQLVHVTSDAMEPGEIARSQSRLEEQWVDTNLAGEVVSLDDLAGTSHPEVLAPLVDREGSGWYVLSPDGFGAGLSSLTGESGGKEDSPGAEGLLKSALTSELAAVCARSFGAILLMEGSDEVENDKARAEIEAAIADIRQGMPDLPKTVVAPPERVVLSGDRRSAERVALWSLGLSTEDQELPRAAVFYGRARWIGPLMEGPQISRGNLARLFSVIGADCECGMDLAWTRGTPLLLRWTDELHATAAKSLGFDPASPMIRAEALRIISRYSRGEVGASYATRMQGEEAPSVPPTKPALVAENSPDRPGVVASSEPPGVPAASPPARGAGGRILLILVLSALALLLAAMLVLLLVFHRVGRRRELAARQAHSRRGKA
ncbi:MAG: hypothetical protein KDM81_13120 [Verrucomicrobiae bacterium]|nr:hypothetical protein [Verrucomicrobiae bacterium]